MDAVAFLGFGEAAQTFAGDARWRGRARGFDVKTDHADTRAAKLDEFKRLNAAACLTAAEAVNDAPLIISVVTADQAGAAADSAAPHLAPGALFLDFNSVAPTTKRAAAQVIDARGGRYVDVAVMSPVMPAALAAPLLLSGADAEQAQTQLRALGFSTVRVVGDRVGLASQIKMVRSVLVKGIEAVTAECLLAAHAAGIVDEVLDSLGGAWRDQANYNLERVLVHGVRRAAELEEVAKTLRDLGVEPALTEAAITWQRALGALGIVPAPPALDAKLTRIETANTASAA